MTTRFPYLAQDRETHRDNQVLALVHSPHCIHAIGDKTVKTKPRYCLFFVYENEYLVIRTGRNLPIRYTAKAGKHSTAHVLVPSPLSAHLLSRKAHCDKRHDVPIPQYCERVFRRNLFFFVSRTMPDTPIVHRSIHIQMSRSETQWTILLYTIYSCLQTPPPFNSMAGTTDATRIHRIPSSYSIGMTTNATQFSKWYFRFVFPTLCTTPWRALNCPFSSTTRKSRS